jgi:GH15 family glucan-1,4-alpha-glucosidase
MALRIEDYAIIGDLQTAALVGRDGSIDWLCVPAFGSDACFAALLGTEEHGNWRVAPRAGGLSTRRRYRPETLIVETEFESPDGAVTVIDFMPHRGERGVDIVRIVRCTRGRVAMRSDLGVRFGYGERTPWIRERGATTLALAGPDGLALTRGDAVTGSVVKDGRIIADFELAEGQSTAFGLSWFPSHEEPATPIDAEAALERSEAHWRHWSSQCQHRGELRDQVMRSLITLKALTYLPTGGIVASPTTSLPEQLGGVRNWDYRFCWLRDATFTLMALMGAGYRKEANAFRDWLLRAVGGHPAEIQVMYGPSGERRLTELELPWLPGYEGSRPVRIGNAAVNQLQLDVYGEVVDSLFQARRAGFEHDVSGEPLWRGLLDFLESHWRDVDEGIWEVRGPPRHFVHSKVMTWVAFDRAVKAVEHFGISLDGPVDKLRAVRDEIHRDVCEKGFDRARGSFTQSYGSEELDASLLMIPQVGFLPVGDPRVVGTVDAIARDLMIDGFVFRYPSRRHIDGLPEGEGAFLACTFWLADAYALLGRRDEAKQIFDRLLRLRNDVGLLSEQYDLRSKRLVGNFPQAFSHVALVNTAVNLAGPRGPNAHRASPGPVVEK